MSTARSGSPSIDPSGSARPAPSTSAAASPTTVAGRRLYPIQVAEKGYASYRLHVRGTWGHGSMPRSDNAAVLAAEVVAPARGPGPDPADAGHAPVPRARGRRSCRRRSAGSSIVSSRDDTAAPRPPSRPPATRRYARALRALVRDTLSPNVITTGIKYNVIPGDATIEVDCRVLPGHDRGGHPGRGHRADGSRPRGRHRDRADRLGRARRGTGRGRAVRPARADDPRARSRGHPAAGDGPVRDRRQAPRIARRPDVRLLARCCSNPTSDSSSASTAWTSESRSTPSRGVCRSCTTSFAASAAEDVRPGSAAAERFAVGAVRADQDLLVARRAAIEPRPSPNRSPGRGRLRRDGSAAGASSPHVPSLWRCWTRTRKSA